MDFGIISLGDYVNQSKTDFRLKRTTHDFVALNQTDFAGTHAERW